MRIALAHNRYGLPGRGSGEEVMIEAIQNLLETRGHQVAPYMRSSLELNEMRFGRAHAFFNGIYSVGAQRDMARFLRREKPDLLLAQNLFPLFSPSILVACRKADIPVIMRCPNYRLICPNGLLMTGGAICEKCSGGKEYWCVLQNCEQNLFKSAGYALRNMVARRLSLFHENVDIFMVLTAFAKQKLLENGFAPDRVQVLSALADPSAFPAVPATAATALGRYVGFVGRVSPEKGVDLLVQAAATLPHIPFKIAGSYDPNDNVTQQAPQNVAFLGNLDREPLIRFYQQARMLVTPSRWYEGLPVVMIEAMLCAKPVIGSRLGGLPDVVEDGRTGLLTPAGDIKALAAAIQRLWDSPEQARQFGLAGRRKAESEYAPDAFYARLMTAYETSLKRHPKRRLAA